MRWLFACGLLGGSVACGDGAAAPGTAPIDAHLTGSTMTDPGVSDTPQPSGTQTGDEGDQLYCGEGPPRWVPVAETPPFPATYRGRLRRGESGAADAELKFSNPGQVLAFDPDTSGPHHEACGLGRMADIDWLLDIDGTVQLAGNGISYLLFGAEPTGELRDLWELPELTLEAEPATVEDFRAVGHPVPYAAGDGPVKVSLYVHVGLHGASVHAQWECSPCGVDRTGLPLAEGELTP